MLDFDTQMHRWINRRAYAPVSTAKSFPLRVQITMSTSANGRREITLLKEQSSGTFAHVHLARCTDSGGLSRIVAVKMLKDRWTETSDILDRTRDEAQLLASLQHPNILKVEAITEIDGLPSIIMEFVNGIDLGQLLDAVKEHNQAIPHRTVYEIAECIASALAAAWFKVPIGRSEPLRVVHRDIKPSNVMISTDGELRVLDFGTARFEDVSRHAKTEAFRFGSLKYMSPERRDGARGEHAADIYSLGLVIIELLTGRMPQPLPFEPHEHERALTKLIDGVPTFGLPNEGWDRSLRETLMRLCAVDPASRLDARQTVKLLRAFKQQATGDGLVAFAEDFVSPIATKLNFIPHDDPETTAELTSFALEADGRTSVLHRSTGMRSKAFSNDLPTQEVAIPQDLPTAEIPFELGPEDEPTQVSREVDTLRPGFAMSDLSPVDTQSSSWNPNTVTRPTATGPTESDVTGRALPPVQPASGPSPKQYLIIGFGVASALIALLAIGGGAAMIFMAKSSPSTPTPSATVPEAAAPLIEADTERFQVMLSAGDPTIQKMRLLTQTGDAVLTARPDANAQIPADDYKLSVKVVGRPTIEGEITITKDTTLTCRQTTMGRVLCVDEDGEPQITLQP